jgi:hypothetical protein
MLVDLVILANLSVLANMGSLLVDLVILANLTVLANMGSLAALGIMADLFILTKLVIRPVMILKKRTYDRSNRH